MRFLVVVSRDRGTGNNYFPIGQIDVDDVREANDLADHMSQWLPDVKADAYIKLQDNINGRSIRVSFGDMHNIIDEFKQATKG